MNRLRAWNFNRWVCARRRLQALRASQKNTPLARVAGPPVLIDYGHDYEEEGREPYEIEVRPKLTLAISGGKEKVVESQHRESRREQPKESVPSLALKTPEVKGRNQAQGDNRTIKEVVHQMGPFLQAAFIPIPTRDRRREAPWPRGQ